MDRLAATGKKVFVNLSVAYKFPPEARAHPLKAIKSEADAEAFVREKVALLKNHPALLGWYIADELPQSMVPTLRARQALLKRLDPEHVTGMCLIGANGLREFSDCADWMGMDCYPVGGLSASEEEKVHPNMQMFSAICERAQEQTKGLKPVWPVPQAFNWAWYRPTVRNPEHRVPTAEEFDNMTWQAIAAGANGLVYYVFEDIFTKQDPADAERTWTYMKKTTLTVRDRMPILLSRPGRTSMTFPKGVNARAWTTDSGETWVLAVNTTRERTGDFAPLESRFFREK